MTKPLEALEDHDRLFKGGSTASSPKLHLSQTCSRSPADMRRIEHRAQLPLRAELCEECDPSVTIDCGRK